MPLVSCHYVSNSFEFVGFKLRSPKSSSVSNTICNSEWTASTLLSKYSSWEWAWNPTNENHNNMSRLLRDATPGFFFSRLWNGDLRRKNRVWVAGQGLWLGGLHYSLQVNTKLNHQQKIVDRVCCSPHCLYTMDVYREWQCLGWKLLGSTWSEHGLTIEYNDDHVFQGPVCTCIFPKACNSLRHIQSRLSQANREGLYVQHLKTSRT